MGLFLPRCSLSLERLQAADQDQGRAGSQPHPLPASSLVGSSVRDGQGPKLPSSHRAPSGLSSCPTAMGRITLHGAAPRPCRAGCGAALPCSSCSQQALRGASVVPVPVKTLPGDLQAPVRAWGVPGCGWL